MRDCGASVSVDSPREDEQKQQNLERRKNAFQLRRRGSMGGGALSPSKPSRQGSVFRPPSSPSFLTEQQQQDRDREAAAEAALRTELQRG